MRGIVKPEAELDKCIRVSNKEWDIELRWEKIWTRERIDYLIN
jgi:hypothetical protein